MLYAYIIYVYIYIYSEDYLLIVIDKMKTAKWFTTRLDFVKSWDGPPINQALTHNNVLLVKMGLGR